jgi:hypothetical protein
MQQPESTNRQQLLSEKRSMVALCASTSSHADRRVAQRVRMDASSLIDRFRDAVCNCLRAAGMLPPDQGLSEDGEAIGPGGDLTAALLRSWQATDCRRGRTYDWLRSQHERGAMLTLGVPGATSPGVSRLLGLRLAWWLDGVPSGRRIGVASSRLGRQLDSQEAWFTLLRAACAKIDTARDVVLAVKGTAPDRFVRRATDLFDLRLLQVEAPDAGSPDPLQWLKNLIDSEPGERSTGCWRLELSPAWADAPLQADDKLADGPPDRDRALVALSDRLFTFHVRHRGNLYQLLKYRLSDPAWPLASIYVALGHKMISPKSEDELLDAGAVGWVVPDVIIGNQSDRLPGGAAVTVPTGGREGDLIRVPAATNWEFLTHCTRGSDGPWPDQDEDDYLDELILSDVTDHSAFAALMRIVTSGRVLASSRGIRGKIPVVCFTAVPLAELSELHVYRKHRARWDFQPYGICVRRQWLEQRGARPVQYGNDQLWSALPPDERPFFQVRQTSSGRMDWRAEREWRHVGEIALADLPPDAGFVFVPSRAEALKLADESPWPVAVVDW